MQYVDEILLTDFQPAHLSGAHALSVALKWPHRLEDWAMLLDLSHGVVAMARGKVIGTALCTQFGAELACVNMVIVADDAQGKGLGRRLMQAVLPEQGACRLVATSEGLPLYRKLGFEETGQIRQYQGFLSAMPQTGGVYSAGPEELARIAAMESASFGGDRTGLVDWMRQNARLYVSRDLSGDETGFAACRPFGRGHVIGPICAPDLGTAKALVAAATHGLEGTFVRIDTGAFFELSGWLEGHGLSHAGGGTVMSCGETDMLSSITRRWALFSQALG